MPPVEPAGARRPRFDPARVTRIPMQPKARVIAFYLPQYHPIPENDAWWGKGFTEWRLVASARPLFRGHRQPQLPGELGFYDLRLPETRAAQAELARTHGVEGFCYWHYWMGNGRRLLERPFEEVLSSGEPDFPFCLGWANHAWKGVFFGAGNRLLIDQTYPGPDDHKAHFECCLRAFRDPRYVTVNGKPLFYILRPWEIPDAARALHQWRTWAVESGLNGLYFVGEGHGFEDAKTWGLDAVSCSRHRSVEQLWPFDPLSKSALKLTRAAFRRPAVYSYRRAMQYFLKPGPVEAGEHPVIVPGWDTTPRLGRRAVVLTGSSPALFRDHVREALARIDHRPHQERLLFAKSWNEWAEGNYLEPDSRFGRGYLDALRRELCGDAPASGSSDSQMEMPQERGALRFVRVQATPG
jgi:hypothetical protein